MADIDEIRLLIQDNFDKIGLRLDDFFRFADKRAKATGKKLTAAFTAFASAKALRVIKDVFANAISDAARFETALLGLKSAASQAGQPFDEVRKRVNELTADGTLGLENVATSFKLLLSQGLQTDKAFKLTESLKKIGALNNIVGDTSQSVFDFVKGIGTASQELVENLDPGLRGVIDSYGGLSKISKDAGARQEFFNAIIARGDSLTADYEETLDTTQGALSRFEKAQERLNVVIGEAVAGPFQGLLDFASSALDSLGSLVSSLGPVGGGIATITAGFAAAAPALVTFTSGLGQLVANGPDLLRFMKDFGKTLLANGPLIGGLTLLAVGIGFAITKLIELGNETENFIKEIDRQNKVIKKSTQVFDELADKKNLNKLETLKLAEADKVLTETSRLLGIELEKENGALKDRKELLEEVKIAQIAETATRIAALRVQVEEFRSGGIINKALEILGKIRPTLGGITPEAQIFGLEKSITKLEIKLEELKAPAEEVGKTMARSFRSSGRAAKKFSNFLDTQFRKSINDLTTEFNKFVKQFPQFVQAATEAFTRRFDELVRSQREKVLAFNDELEEIAVRRIRAEAQVAEDAIEDLALLGIITEQEASDERVKIRKKEAVKIAKIQLDAAKKTIDQVNSIIEATAGVVSTGADAKASELLSGAAGVTAVIPGGQIASGVLGAASGIASIFETILDDTELIKEQEELKRQEIERQNKALETQRKITQALVDLNTKRSELISESVRLQIKVNNLTLGKEAARKANIAELEALATRRAGEAGLSGATPQAIIGDIEQSKVEQAATEFALSVLDRVGPLPAIGPNGELPNQELKDRKGLLEQALQPGLPSSIRSAIQNAINAEQRIRDLFAAQRAEAARVVAGGAVTTESAAAFRAREAAIRPAFAAAPGQFQAAAAIARNQANALRARLGQSGELLDLLIEIQSLQDQVNDATAQTIELQSDRERSFIDVSQRGLFSLGQFQQARIDPSALAAPSGVQTLALATERAKSFQERSADALERTVDLLTQIRDLSAAIAQNTDPSTPAASGNLQNTLLTILADAQSRAFN